MIDVIDFAIVYFLMMYFFYHWTFPFETDIAALFLDLEDRLQKESKTGISLQFKMKQTNDIFGTEIIYHKSKSYLFLYPNL